MKTIDHNKNELAEFCKALGHPVRMQIIEHLLKEDRCICGEIVNNLPLAQSTVSQHLKVLKTSAIIKGEIDGPKTCYCIDHQYVAKKLIELQSFFSIRGE